MVSATGDWTRNTPKEEFPAVQSIYRLLNAENNVESVQVDERHNYNQESREAVYTFFGTRLAGTSGHVAEARFRVEFPQDLLALFGRTRPANAVSMERYVADRIADARAGIQKLEPHDETSLAQARDAFRDRLTYSMLTVLPRAGDVVSQRRGDGSRRREAIARPLRKGRSHPSGLAERREDRSADRVRPS